MKHPRMQQAYKDCTWHPAQYRDDVDHWSFAVARRTEELACMGRCSPVGLVIKGLSCSESGLENCSGITNGSLWMFWDTDSHHLIPTGCKDPCPPGILSYRDVFKGY